MPIIVALETNDKRSEWTSVLNPVVCTYVTSKYLSEVRLKKPIRETRDTQCCFMLQVLNITRLSIGKVTIEQICDTDRVHNKCVCENYCLLDRILYSMYTTVISKHIGHS